MRSIWRFTSEQGDMKTIFDRDFKYVPSVATDLRKTFARIRREQQSNKQSQNARSIAEARENVVTLSVKARTASSA
jgi:hypothetical protein